LLVLHYESLTMIIPDAGYSRNASCALHSTFSSHHNESILLYIIATYIMHL